MSETQIYENAHKTTMCLFAYLALTGRLIFVKDNQEAFEVLEQIRIIGGFDFEPSEVFDRVFNYCSDGVIHSIVVNTIDGDRQISFVIGTKEEPVPKKLDTAEGVLAYVYNIDKEYSSELGDIFLKNIDSVYHRVR